MTLTSLVDLAIQSGTDFSPKAINDTGDIVGWIDVPTGPSTYSSHACLYSTSSGVLTDLGTPPGGSASIALAINNSGEIVGSWVESNYSSTDITHGFHYSNGIMSDLGALPGALTTSAAAINDSGQIVGYSGLVVAFLYSNGAMLDLGTLSGDPSLYAVAINNAGDIGGWIWATVGVNPTVTHEHACVFSTSTGILTDLGTLPGGDWSDVYGINSSGDAIGAADVASVHKATSVVYSKGTVTDIGRLTGDTLSEGIGINDSGVVIGNSVKVTASGLYYDTAYIYSRGTMKSLGLLPGGIESHARAINNAGIVVGWASTTVGSPSGALESHGFLYDSRETLELTALVSGTTGAPSGAVTFVDNGAALATLTISPVPANPGSAGATFTTGTLSSGTHALSAVYTPAGGSITPGTTISLGVK